MGATLIIAEWRTLLILGKEMILIYSVIKYIDYMTENYFLREREILFFLWNTETTSKIFDLLKCLIIVITESIESFAAIYPTWNLHPYFIKTTEYRCIWKIKLKFIIKRLYPLTLPPPIPSPLKQVLMKISRLTIFWIITSRPDLLF